MYNNITHRARISLWWRQALGQRAVSPAPRIGVSYQGDPGTGVDATGLVPLGALSSLVTRIDGGSCE